MRLWWHRTVGAVVSVRVLLGAIAFLAFTMYGGLAILRMDFGSHMTATVVHCETHDGRRGSHTTNCEVAVRCEAHTLEMAHNNPPGTQAEVIDFMGFSDPKIQRWRWLSVIPGTLILAAFIYHRGWRAPSGRHAKRWDQV